MKDDLSRQDLDIISDEDKRYRDVFVAIEREMGKKSREVQHDEKLSRELTAKYVGEKNEEEKQFLQSDEFVAHSLVSLRLRQANALSELARQPYFARVIYHEKGRDVEFRLGVASFPEERIIDWRKAPISRLYYDYDEGDDYDDEIVGVDRQGKIKLKRAYRGRLGELHSIDLKDVSYQKFHGKWRLQRKLIQSPFSLKDKAAIKKMIAAQGEFAGWEELEEGYLSEILTLLSPDQFRLISTRMDEAMIIQGSAGTGKTTVAMHRLAWLLFEGNSTARAENCLVIMPNPVLVEYVKKILPSLGVPGVSVTTHENWLKERGKKYPSRLEHLVVDEVQDFSLGQLNDLLSHLDDPRHLTLAGDLGQRIHVGGFYTWNELLSGVGFRGLDVMSLSVAYRSTWQIYQIAEHIRDPMVKDEDLKLIPKFGPEPTLTVAHNFAEALELTRVWIEDVININQKTIGAILCRDAKEARFVFESLLKAGVRGIRHGDAQHFEFTPGITVTDVRQVKGLEFQALFLFNPSEANYPHTSREARNLLYVATTRAIHKLDMVVYQKPSRILPNRLNLTDLTEIEAESDAERDRKPGEVEDVYEMILGKKQKKILTRDELDESYHDRDDHLTEDDDELGIFGDDENKN